MKLSLNNAGTTVAQVTVIALTLFVTLDVVLRYVFNRPMPFSNDVSGFLMVGITFLGLAYAERVGAHVNVSVITSLLSKRVQSPLRMIVWIFELFWSIIFCVSAYMVLKDFYEIGTVSIDTDWPLYPFAIVMLIGAIMLVFESLSDRCRPFSTSKNHEKSGHGEGFGVSK